MSELLHRVLDAHGGLEPWLGFNFVQATIVTGGELFAMKSEPQDPVPRRMTVATKKEWASVTRIVEPAKRRKSFRHGGKRVGQDGDNHIDQ